MTQGVESIEIKTGFMIEAQNSCSLMGSYYSEDDWIASGIGSTFEEAIIKMGSTIIIHHGIYIDHITFSKVKYVTYKNRNVVLEIVETVTEYTNREKYIELYNRMIASKEWKEILSEVKKEQERVAQEEKEERQRLKDTAEHLEYLRLKEKFEDQ